MKETANAWPVAGSDLRITFDYFLHSLREAVI